MEPVTLYRVGPKDHGKRLDRFLAERIPRLSRSRIQRGIAERVRVSWTVRVGPATRVRSGGEVRVGFPPLQETPCEIELPLLARERGWIAIDKPAGIPVHPMHTVRANSLIQMLRRSAAEPGLRLAHRLDRETSGVLLVARDAAHARWLSRAFERGEVHKEYLALVRGRVAPHRGEIEWPIGRDPGTRVHVKLAAARAGEVALERLRPAKTRWRVVCRAGDRTLLRISPVTGRRHQIRVHLAALGHPVLGDLLYGETDEVYLRWLRGGPDPRATGRLPSRHLLHCTRLSFRDRAGWAHTVGSPLPADFRAWVSGGRPCLGGEQTANIVQ